VQTVTNWQGLIHERLEYTPYGELWIDWRAPGALHATPFRFTGHEHDRETGLIYAGARYLDPRTSRWLSTDPAMWQGDFLPSAPISAAARQRNENLPNGGVFNAINLHVFNYSNNNPIRYVDPDGRTPRDRIDELGTRPFEPIPVEAQTTTQNIGLPGRTIFVGVGPQQSRDGHIRTTYEDRVQWFDSLPELTVEARPREYDHMAPSNIPGRSVGVETHGTEFSVFDSNGDLRYRFHDINNDSWIDFVERF